MHKRTTLFPDVHGQHLSLHPVLKVPGTHPHIHLTDILFLAVPPALHLLRSPLLHKQHRSSRQEPSQQQHAAAVLWLFISGMTLTCPPLLCSRLVNREPSAARKRRLISFNEKTGSLKVTTALQTDVWVAHQEHPADSQAQHDSGEDDTTGHSETRPRLHFALAATALPNVPIHCLNHIHILGYDMP